MSKENARKGEDRGPLAAEYVLGVLELPERQRVRRLMAEDPGFAGLVAEWEERLLSLADDYPSVEPPAQAKAAAADRRNAMRRRLFLSGMIASTTTASMLRARKASGESKQDQFEIVRSESEWRAMLSEEEFLVLRQEETERAFTSALLDEKRDGLYTCAGCGLALFSSKAKYDSGTGWPSFSEPLPVAVRTREDRRLIFSRTEVHCRRCGGHLGHVFDDGPAPTGKRYCINGIALDFVPSQNG